MKYGILIGRHSALSICQHKWTAIISKGGTMAEWRAQFKARGSTHRFLFIIYFLLIYLVPFQIFFLPEKHSSDFLFVAAAALKRAAT